ncbi:hypothetical protein COW95_00950 [Candidatus Peregrinibacteria bacterium CG22_combo_CG10-13_8_21_14_all_49_11]|nr:MAG: hypothetical protein COW95_00950 [Candidatus Peregrinibacteria bacterium CG22_combo_CG10-13_8_21_14_all_49_11]
MWLLLVWNLWAFGAAFNCANLQHTLEREGRTEFTSWESFLLTYNVFSVLVGGMAGFAALVTMQ